MPGDCCKVSITWVSNLISTSAGIGKTAAVGDVQIANHSFATFVDEKTVTENAATIDGRISGENFRIHIAQNHLRRTGVIPGKQARPRPVSSSSKGRKSTEEKCLRSRISTWLLRSGQEQVSQFARQNFEFSGFAGREANGANKLAATDGDATKAKEVLGYAASFSDLAVQIGRYCYAWHRPNNNRPLRRVMAEVRNAAPGPCFATSPSTPRGYQQMFARLERCPSHS